MLDAFGLTMTVNSSLYDWYKIYIKDPHGNSLRSHPDHLSSQRPSDLHDRLDQNQTESHDDIGNAITYHGILRLCGAVLSLVFNLLILSVILIKRNLRDSMDNVLLCHLGVLGLFHTILLIPTYTSLVFSFKWHHAEALCIFQGFLTHVLTIATLLTLTAINIEKYRTITQPLHYQNVVSKKKMMCSLFGIWITSLTLCVLTVSVGPGYTYTESKACCDIDYVHTPGGLPRWIVLPVLITSVYVPGSILFYCHYRIFIIVRGHKKRITNMLAMATLSFQAPITRSTTSPSKEQKASKTISVYLGSFFLCYVPYSVLSILQVTLLLPINPHVIASVTTLHHCSPLFNALVYGTMNKALRDCVVKAVRHSLYSRHDINQRNGMKEVLSTPLLGRPQIVVDGDRRNSLMLAKVEKLQREVRLKDLGDVVEFEERCVIRSKDNGVGDMKDIYL